MSKAFNDYLPWVAHYSEPNKPELKEVLAVQ